MKTLKDITKQIESNFEDAQAMHDFYWTKFERTGDSGAMSEQKVYGAKATAYYDCLEWLRILGKGSKCQN
jgi:hypothetical protein